jgi:hypothetical protein
VHAEYHAGLVRRTRPCEDAAVTRPRSPAARSSAHSVARSLAPAVAALPLLLAAACTLEDKVLLGKVSTSLPVIAAVQLLDAEVSVGSLTVREHDATQIDVSAEVWVAPSLLPPAAADGKRPPPRLEDWLTVAQEGGTVRLREVRKDDDHELRVVVTLPAAARGLQLRTRVGTVDATVAEASDVRLVCDVGSARLRAGKVTGAVTGRVTTGKASVAVTEGGPASADLDVATGALRLSLPKSVSGEFDCAVDLGSIAGADTVGLTAERATTAATARGRRGNGTGRFKLHVATGEIRFQ